MFRKKEGLVPDQTQNQLKIVQIRLLWITNDDNRISQKTSPRSLFRSQSEFSKGLTVQRGTNRSVNS